MAIRQYNSAYKEYTQKKKKRIVILSLFCLILTGVSACTGKTEQGQETQAQKVQEQEAAEQETQGQETQGQETQEQEAQGQEVFEAKESGIAFTVPDEYKALKGTVKLEDFGEDLTTGRGYVQMAGFYYPMGGEEVERLYDEEAQAEENGDLDAIKEIMEQMN